MLGNVYERLRIRYLSPQSKCAVWVIFQKFVDDVLCLLEFALCFIVHGLQAMIKEFEISTFHLDSVHNRASGVLACYQRLK